MIVNHEIRQKLRENNLTVEDMAEQLPYEESMVFEMLRFKLSPEDKKDFMRAIDLVVALDQYASVLD